MPNPATDMGFTKHEMLNNVVLVHMNARIYDPLRGRFLSADTIIPDITNLQSFDRYQYCYNNPVSHTDPSGHVAFNLTFTVFGNSFDWSNGGEIGSFNFGFSWNEWNLDEFNFEFQEIIVAGLGSSEEGQSESVTVDLSPDLQNGLSVTNLEINSLSITETPTVTDLYNLEAMVNSEQSPSGVFFDGSQTRASDLAHGGDEWYHHYNYGSAANFSGAATYFAETLWYSKSDILGKEHWLGRNGRLGTEAWGGNKPTGGKLSFAKNRSVNGFTGKVVGRWGGRFFVGVSLFSSGQNMVRYHNAGDTFNFGMAAADGGFTIAGLVSGPIGAAWATGWNGGRAIDETFGASDAFAEWYTTSNSTGGRRNRGGGG